MISLFFRVSSISLESTNVRLQKLNYNENFEHRYSIDLEDLGSCRVLPLGIACSKLPTDLKLAKFLLTASLFGRDILESAAILAGALESRSPFLAPPGQRNQADAARNKFNAESNSDSLTLLHAYESWIASKRSKSFCRKNFLSHFALLEISRTREHLLKSISKTGFRTSSAVSRDMEVRDRLLRACLVSAFWPNIVAVEKPRECDKTRNWIKRDGSHVCMHPSSLNHSSRLSEFHVAGRRMLWCVFVEFFQTSREFIRDSTLVDAMSCAILCGGERKVLHTKGRFHIDDWMEFAASARTASIVKRLSEVFQEVFRDRLRKKVLDSQTLDQSSVPRWSSCDSDAILDLVVKILSEKPCEEVIYNKGVSC